MKFKPTVGAENDYTFVQIIEGLALHLDQGVVFDLKSDAVCYVLIKENKPAQGVRATDKMKAAPVGEVPCILSCTNNLRIKTKLGFFPGTEIALFRQTARFAQALQNLRVRRLSFQPSGVEIP